MWNAYEYMVGQNQETQREADEYAAKRIEKYANKVVDKTESYNEKIRKPLIRILENQ